ncbi:MAG: TRAP transporter small permease subunit [Pseudomonadota bacterium]
MTFAPVYRQLDRLLEVVARIGSVAMLALVCITVYDVMTRYFGLPKFAGLNSTMLQESEYWAHTILFSLVMAYAYTKQAHVRIDLVRDALPTRVKYYFEIFGLVVFLLPFSAIAARYTYNYVYISWRDAEVSPSTVGLTNFWIVKSMLLVMFILMFIAGISQLLKCIDGLRGKLSPEEKTNTLGGGH